MDVAAMLAEQEERRRHVPGPVAIMRAVRRGRGDWDDPEARAFARRAIFAVIGRDDDALARSHLVEHAVREELIWRPWDAPLGAWTGASQLDAAIATGRGVVVSFVHSGPFPGISAALATRTDRLHVVVGDWMLVPYEDDEEGRRRARWLANMQALPVQLMPQKDCYPALAAALRRGQVVATAFDAPGRRDTAFLGRRVALAQGGARLAVETGALVVPVWRARERWRVRTVVGAALEPGDDIGALHDELARLHTAWILARPAALEDPTREGWWGFGIHPYGASAAAERR